MTISIVISIYNEEKVLPHFLKSLINNVESISENNLKFEIIFVDDGSSDNSVKIVRDFSISKRSPYINWINIILSKNFGHEAAMIAGIDKANGDAIICMDSDLQHPPDKIKELIENFQNHKVDVINMVRDENRKYKLSNLFYKFANLLSDEKIQPNASDFFLISARVAKNLKQDYRERVRFLRGLIQMMGYTRLLITYTVHPRNYGKSKYSFVKLLSLSFDAIATLSIKPLRIGLIFSFLSAIFSVLLFGYSLLMKFIDQPVSGYTTIIVFLSLMFSIQFFILGIIGEYVGFIFYEQKGRPIYLINEIKDYSKEL